MFASLYLGLTDYLDQYHKIFTSWINVLPPLMNDNVLNRCYCSYVFSNFQIYWNFMQECRFHWSFLSTACIHWRRRRTAPGTCLLPRSSPGPLRSLPPSDLLNFPGVRGLKSSNTLSSHCMLIPQKDHLFGLPITLLQYHLKLDYNHINCQGISMRLQ